MPSTRTVEVFTFAELTGTAKEHARQWYSEHHMGYRWRRFVYEDWDAKLSALGLTLEQLAEVADANDWVFTADGRFFS